MREARRETLEKYITCRDDHSKKLMIGAGMMRRQGWKTLDAMPQCTPDILAAVPPLPKECTNNDWTEIEMIHFLEHLDKWRAEELLKEIRRKALKPSRGKLVIEVPNLAVCMPIALDETQADGRQNRFGFHPILGTHEDGNAFQRHMWGYTPDSLRRVLMKAGFRDDHIKLERAKHHYPDRDMRMVATT